MTTQQELVDNFREEANKRQLRASKVGIVSKIIFSSILAIALTAGILYDWNTLESFARFHYFAAIFIFNILVIIVTGVASFKYIIRPELVPEGFFRKGSYQLYSIASPFNIVLTFFGAGLTYFYPELRSDAPVSFFQFQIILWSKVFVMAIFITVLLASLVFSKNAKVEIPPSLPQA